MNPSLLNSLTKFPSIPTFHEMLEGGGLGEACVELTGPVVVTEKINGTNTRLIVCDDGVVVGSREELLYRVGDYVRPLTQGIVPAALSIAERLVEAIPGDPGAVLVLYGEVYGWKVGAAAGEYAVAEGQTGFRLFDAWRFSAEDVARLGEFNPSQLSGWRDQRGHAEWAEVERLGDMLRLPVVPVLDDLFHRPLTHEQAEAYIHGLAARTEAALSTFAKGGAEGVVVRQADGKRIAKLRHEDYQRMRRRAKR